MSYDEAKFCAVVETSSSSSKATPSWDEPEDGSFHLSEESPRVSSLDDSSLRTNLQVYHKNQLEQDKNSFRGKQTVF